MIGTPANIRFFRSIEISSKHEGCWLWKGRLNEYGYGLFIDDHELILAYRFAFRHFNGDIPPNCDIHHKCKVRRCVNPKHLELLTRDEHIKLHRIRSLGG